MATEPKLRDLLRAMHLLGAVNEGAAVAPGDLCPLLRDASFSEIESLMDLGERLGYLSRVGDKFYLTFRGEISVISISS